MLIALREHVLRWESLPHKRQPLSAACGARRVAAGGAKERGSIAPVPAKGAEELGPFLK